MQQTRLQLLTVIIIISSMINYIKGNVKLKFNDSILVVGGNLGFKINVANIDKFLLDSETELFVKGYVRDDVYVYYGFNATNEYELFESLLKVDGVGPKTAMSILAKIPMNELVGLISKADFAKIKTYGISDKIAKKIVVELANLDVDLSVEGSSIPDESIEALKNLGFSREQIVAKLANSSFSTPEEYIKFFLKKK